MASIIATMLGESAGKKVEFTPPKGKLRRCNLADFDAPVGSFDTDDGSYSSFADLIEPYHPVTQERLVRIAWAIRRTGCISSFEMSHILDVTTSYMSKLWRIFVEQGWVVSERRKGLRHSLFYQQTELGKRMFANAGDTAAHQKAA